VSAEWKRPEKVLVCFAVKEEASPFRKASGTLAGIEILITGMGRRNAESTIGKALKSEKLGLVLTCGFAGGLRPGLGTGAVLYETKDETLRLALEAAGARTGRFLFSSQVATTAKQKRDLWEKTKADAVEMESEAIRLICDENGVRNGTVRVVLDTAEEDLPLDFNALMTPDQNLSYGKLAGLLMRSPGKIPALLRLQKQSQAAAEKLSNVLTHLLKA
jgi:nucleoside phosphorylase